MKICLKADSLSLPDWIVAPSWPVDTPVELKRSSLADTEGREAGSVGRKRGEREQRRVRERLWMMQS